MRILFLVQKEAWFVEHQRAWYRLDDMEEVGLGLCGLVLNMINQYDLIEQPHHAGSARITQTNDRTLRVTLMTADKVKVDSIDVQLDQSTLLNVHWNTKQFPDGWMSAEAQVTLDNVGAMFVDAYLPAREGADGKMLRISDTKSGTVKEVWLARNKKTRVSVVDVGKTGKVCLTLKCEPEPVAESTDPRQLGFVMIGRDIRPL